MALSGQMYLVLGENPPDLGICPGKASVHSREDESPVFLPVWTLVSIRLFKVLICETQ